MAKSKWGTLPESNSIYGGNLQGIIDKLDYLEKPWDYIHLPYPDF